MLSHSQLIGPVGTNNPKQESEDEPQKSFKLAQIYRVKSVRFKFLFSKKKEVKRAADKKKIANSNANFEKFRKTFDKTETNFFVS